MKYINSIKISLLIVFIFFFTFCSGYTMGSSFVYADSTTDNWQNVTTNQQLVEAFRYYCKSRDLTIDGSVADAVTTFTTSTFNGICKTLGINVTALQAEIKYQTDGNLGNRFLFSALGIDAYNRIFSQFLQDNDLNVGDSVNNQTVASGEVYAGQFIYVFNKYDNSILQQPIKVGSPILGYVGSDFASLNGSTISVPIFDNVVNMQISSTTSSKTIYFVQRQEYPSYTVYISNNTYIGRIAYVRFNNTYPDRIYCCNVQYKDGGYNIYTNWGYVTRTDNESYNPNVNIYLTTNNTVINNNTYEGDTIINNNGTPSDPNNPTPDPDPEPDNPVLPAPDTQPATDWDIELPDLTVPNWILSGKENKFPFDIPFNVMYALSLLQAEPEAPRLQGTVDFGFYEWDYDLDLSDFDTVAEICRNMEVLAFITGLMLMTRKLIWG